MFGERVVLCNMIVAWCCLHWWNGTSISITFPTENSFSISGDLFKGVLIRVSVAKWFSFIFFTIFWNWWNWAKTDFNKIILFCENIFVLCCGRGTRSLSRRVPCPFLKVVLEAKKCPPKKIWKATLLYIYIKNITNIFHFGLPQCMLLLVRSQAASDLCKAEEYPFE